MTRTQLGYVRDGAIGAALAIIPPHLHERVACDMFIGASPVFAGVFPHATTTDGRSYHVTACCAYEHHTIDRRVTVCLPRNDSPSVIVHEFGHVLHGGLGWEPVCTPVTRYAQRNTMEAFAEAFTAWCGAPGYEAIRVNPADAALFDSL